MKLNIHWLLAAIFLSSCASVHPGKMGEVMVGTPDPLVLLSAKRQSDVSDDHYTFITFTTENKGNDMLRILTTELTPTWASPRAPPPCSAKPTVGRLGLDVGSCATAVGSQSMSARLMNTSLRRRRIALLQNGNNSLWWWQQGSISPLA